MPFCCFSITPARASRRQPNWSWATCRWVAGTAGMRWSTIHGKGGKVRQCPLWPHTERALAELVQGRTDNDAVFLSQHRAPYTRYGVYRLVRRCAARVPGLSKRMITPHVVRHTSACHLLQAGVDLNTIRVWLGHANLDTTNIYVEIDLEMKAKAMKLFETAEPGPRRSWKNDRGLMNYLKTL